VKAVRTVPAPEPGLAEKLRRLARRVERLGVSSRLDPEAITLEKLSVARDLRRAGGILSRPSSAPNLKRFLLL
jgi:hypothetical protein